MVSLVSVVSDRAVGDRSGEHARTGRLSMHARLDGPDCYTGKYGDDHKDVPPINRSLP